ncbi:Protein arginine methyltransferase RmtB [Rasamsonia emersonii CBS 393.64]|uniref:type I protein arginine methyltransferase n=1 Tax=Rasamsonia emersonii (strain ATCC 16479 / CBS 393.64 / IMI 116815) TaxID=1408163 RepID=A0A0F4Z194_RASE3|nr:Protein arginine methyltransferase RmtB [Rasamsonia emersonii CBS 393.64]KKA23628.1 Protein arginine methyltransferase RmtB [Rasamsonia emersonii CBS 393.64]
MSGSLPSSAAAAVDDLHSEDSESATDSLNPANDEGWEDIEPEDDSQPVVGLFSDDVYPDVRSMLKESRERYNFDLVKVQKSLVKLVNYIRSEVKKGNRNPDVSSKSLFEDDIYLKPVLDDDALLYSLEDLEDEPETVDGGVHLANGRSSAEKRIIELQEELERLQGQFTDYRLAVQRSLNEQLFKDEDPITSSGAPERKGSVRKKLERDEEADADYLTSYSYNGASRSQTIHESMLKDTVRTDAYRDFIYDNKGLFKNKIVLDVGCGTSILSMFCAKAGAKMVIAVDNSNIIEKARENVYANGFGDVIKCLHGKIEEVSLPVSQVDIIVSEWMGYGLLFEAMLDSVLWARDRYLAPDGLMVPSHATLRIAPYVDPDYIDSHVSFWKSVYGFDMSSMLANIHDEVIVKTTKPSNVAAEPAVFLQLPLHTITVEELTFVKNFEVTLTEDIDALDGWNIWFDIFFMPSRTSKIKDDAVPSEMKKQGFVAFTTGPHGPETHWQQCVLLINHGGKDPVPLKKGQVIKGEIGYRKKEERSRALEIEIQWAAEGMEKQQQTWSLQ